MFRAKGGMDFCLFVIVRGVKCKSRKVFYSRRLKCEIWQGQTSAITPRTDLPNFNAKIGWDVWIGERCQTPPSRKATEDKSFLGDPLGFRAPRFNPSFLLQAYSRELVNRW